MAVESDDRDDDQSRQMYNYSSRSIIIWISVRDTVIIEYNIIHSHIPNYTKLAFNSLKMIQNDSFSANQTGDGRRLTAVALPDEVVFRDWLVSRRLSSGRGRRHHSDLQRTETTRQSAHTVATVR